VLAGGKAHSARYRYCMAADQVTDGKATPGLGKPQVFRSPFAVGIWWVWLVFVAANLIDLAVQGRDHFSLVAAGILVLSVGVAYVAAERPRVIAEDDALTVRNPFRDHRIPWVNISRVDVSDLLRVHCRLPGPAEPEGGVGAQAGKRGKAGKQGKVISAWALHYSRRRQYSAEVKARRDAMRAAGTRRTSGMSQFGIPQTRSRQPASYGSAASHEGEAMKIARLLNDRATTAAAQQPSGRDETAEPETILASYQAATTLGPGSGGTLLTSTWSGRAIAALLVPAVILLICCLV
jgi:hypothetical protein